MGNKQSVQQPFPDIFSVLSKTAGNLHKLLQKIFDLYIGFKDRIYTLLKVTEGLKPEHLQRLHDLRNQFKQNIACYSEMMAELKILCDNATNSKLSNGCLEEVKRKLQEIHDSLATSPSSSRGSSSSSTELNWESVEGPPNKQQGSSPEPSPIMQSDKFESFDAKCKKLISDIQNDNDYEPDRRDAFSSIFSALKLAMTFREMLLKHLRVLSVGSVDSVLGVVIAVAAFIAALREYYCLTKQIDEPIEELSQLNKYHNQIYLELMELSSYRLATNETMVVAFSTITQKVSTSKHS